MSLTATYDSVLSRIQLAMTGAGGTATYCIFDRTTDGVNYTVIRGGSVVAIASTNAAANDYEFPPGVLITYRARTFTAADALVDTFTDTINQDLTSVWIKVPAAPFLNQEVNVFDRSEATRTSRSGLFPIVGRSNPVMVGDVASSISYTLQLLSTSPSEERDLDFLFASGEVVFIQLPSTVNYMQGGYFAVGDASRAPVSKKADDDQRIWSIPLTGVAAPGPEVVGSAYTWTSVLADYATWSDLMANNATWADLLARTGSPSDVIVP